MEELAISFEIKQERFDSSSHETLAYKEQNEHLRMQISELTVCNKQLEAELGVLTSQRRSFGERVAELDAKLSATLSELAQRKAEIGIFQKKHAKVELVERENLRLKEENGSLSARNTCLEEEIDCFQKGKFCFFVLKNNPGILILFRKI